MPGSALLPFRSVRGHMLLLEPLDEPTVLDLGSNHGRFSLDLAARVGGTYRLYEANPALVEGTTAHPRMAVTHAAVAGADGETTLNVASNDEGSSLLELPETSAFDCVRSGAVTVPVVSLDHVLADVPDERIDVVKMDIEGSEVAALAAVDLSSLRQRVAQLTVEFHGAPEFGFGIARDVEAVIARVASAGFEVLDFSPDRTNVLFVNRELLGLTRWRCRAYREWARRGHPLKARAKVRSRLRAPAETGPGRPDTQPAADSTLPVTVVIPVYNRADKLGRALASIAAQRPQLPAEVIVVDDCSSDDSAAVAEAAGVRVIRHAVNQGEAISDNDGVAAATQPWVAFLDSDDAYLPHFLDTLWALRGDHVAVTGKALVVNEDTGELRVGPPPMGSRPEVLRGPADLLFPAVRIAASGVIARRDAVLACGGFDPRLRRAVDLDFDLRLLEQGTAAVSPEVVTLYYVHAGQSSSALEETVRSADDVVRSYADRAWWSDAAYERWTATLRWDALRRRPAAGGDPLGAARELAWFLRSPLRAGALLTLLRCRLAVRRRSSRFTADGGPSRAVVPTGAGALPALVRLARRPTAEAPAGPAAQRALLRLLGIRRV